MERSALYYRNHPNIPNPDLIQKRNALAGMSLSGSDLVVKLVPLEFSKGLDDVPAGYRFGSGIPQWILSPKSDIEGHLLFTLAGQDLVPWQLPPNAPS